MELWESIVTALADGANGELARVEDRVVLRDVVQYVAARGLQAIIGGEAYGKAREGHVGCYAVLEVFVRGENIALSALEYDLSLASFHRPFGKASVEHQAPEGDDESCFLITRENACLLIHIENSPLAALGE